MAPLASRARRIADARLLLDWLEDHPAVPLPSLDLAAVLHNTSATAAAVLDRASATSKVPFEVTPAGGKVLRFQIGTVSYRLVVLPPPPPAREPTHTVTPSEPRRTSRIRKPKQRPARTRTERPTT